MVIITILVNYSKVIRFFDFDVILILNLYALGKSNVCLELNYL